jgi:phosphoribosylformylglycinamidine synthase
MAHPLTDDELKKVEAMLGRAPNGVERALFSAMWSEHCSYKSSRAYLKKLPTTGAAVLQGPGENAGVVDLGDGRVAVFKVESHNHPSYIEPFQGAATGVGGILRDIFTMGARPVAFLNSLRFGPMDVPKNRYLMEQVVAGIAAYGNCIGVPTVGGEIYFNEIYSHNPIVNVFCIGIAERHQIIKATAAGVGNPVFYVGSKTGRDGIHGATMASAALGKIEEKRHTVQVGDPFCGKILMEACLEAIATGRLVGIQDMGAAGLTSSSSEMAHRGGVGLEIDLLQVPRREEGMTAEEIMLSESQERMLLVVHAGFEAEVEAVFKKWRLACVQIGHVTSDGLLTLKEGEQTVASVPVSALTEEAPVYQRPAEAPLFHEMLQSLAVEALPLPKSYADVLLTLLGSPNLASRRSVYQQFDHMVGTDTVIGPGAGAAVLRIKGTETMLAMTLDGNATYGLLNPYYGGAIAVAEAARNLIAVGAEPLALSDGLNFGNPERPEVMWQFGLCLEGMAEACRQLQVPVISGNVSFYNETREMGIYPTPIVAMVGQIRGHAPLSPGFKTAGEKVLLIGETLEELGGSEYLKIIHHQERGFPPILHFEREVAVQKGMRAAIEAGLLTAAQDCAEGGLAVALAECCIHSEFEIGARLKVDVGQIRPDAFLFGESQSRFVVTTSAGNLSRLEAVLDEAGATHAIMGETGGDVLEIRQADGFALSLPVSQMKTTHAGGLFLSSDERGVGCRP